MKEVLSEFEPKQKGSDISYKIASVLFLLIVVVSILQYYFPFSSQKFSAVLKKPYTLFFILVFQVLPLAVAILFLFKKKIGWYFSCTWSITFAAVLTKIILKEIFVYNAVLNFSTFLNRGVFNIIVYLVLIALLLSRPLLHYLSISKKNVWVMAGITTMLVSLIFLSDS